MSWLSSWVRAAESSHARAVSGDRQGPGAAPEGRRQSRHAGKIAQAPASPSAKRYGGLLDGEAHQAPSPVQLRKSHGPRKTRIQSPSPTQPHSEARKRVSQRTLASLRIRKRSGDESAGVFLRPSQAAATGLPASS